MSIRHILIVNLNVVLNMATKAVALMCLCAEYLHILTNLKNNKKIASVFTLV